MNIEIIAIPGGHLFLKHVCDIAKLSPQQNIRLRLTVRLSSNTACDLYTAKKKVN